MAKAFFEMTPQGVIDEITKRSSLWRCRIPGRQEMVKQVARQPEKVRS